MLRIILIIIIAVWVGDLSAQTRSVGDLFRSPPKQTDQSAPTADKQPAPAPKPQAIATVNRAQIGKEEFLKVMYASSGMRILRQMIGLELAKQMATAEGIEVGDREIDEEFRSIVGQLGPERDNLGRMLTLEDRRRILEGIIERRGISMEEFRIGIEQQAYLRAVVRKNITITDEILKEEFEQTYGPKRTIRGIAVQDRKIGEEVYNQLQKGEPFSALAVKYSIDFQSAPIGGQLGELAVNDPRFPPLLVEEAFKLPVGEFSPPIKIDQEFWIIKVEQESAAQPITLDEVRTQLIDQLNPRLENQMIEKLQSELIKAARIKVDDQRLAKKFESWLKEIQTQE